ncbi:MAG: hypothetical protein ACRD4C_02890 [Candidatus Acidiferrales bacterium]
MFAKRKNRDVVEKPKEFSPHGGTSPDPRPPDPLVAVRESLRLRLIAMQDSLVGNDEERTQLTNDVEAVQKQIFEIDRAFLTMPILEKIAELYS